MSSTISCLLSFISWDFKNLWPSIIEFPCFDLWILCVELNCRFILSAAVIGLLHQPMNVLIISNLIAKLEIDLFAFHRRLL